MNGPLRHPGPIHRRSSNQVADENEIHTPPSAIVICSDCKAALYSIRSDSANARADLVRHDTPADHPLWQREGWHGSEEWGQGNRVCCGQHRPRLSRHLFQVNCAGVETVGVGGGGGGISAARHWPESGPIWLRPPHPTAGTRSSSPGCRHTLHASCTVYTWTGGRSCAYPHLFMWQPSSGLIICRAT